MDSRRALIAANLPNDVVSRVVYYRPSLIGEADWAAIRPCFLEVVGRFSPQNQELFKNTRTPVARFLAWSYGRGYDLDDIDELFDPDRVDLFISTLPAAPHRREYKARLRQVARRVAPNAPWPGEPPRDRKSRLLPPYTDRELGLLFADAAHQKTQTRRDAFHLILVLGLGVGANGGDISRVRGTDICSDPRGNVFARFDTPPRTVPAREGFAAEILDHAEAAGDGPMLAGAQGKNGVAEKIRKFQLGRGSPSLKPDRLKTTWAVHLLWLGVPITELKRAMGVTTLEPFIGLLEHVEPRPDEEYCSFLSTKFYWDFFA